MKDLANVGKHLQYVKGVLVLHFQPFMFVPCLAYNNSNKETETVAKSL